MRNACFTINNWTSADIARLEYLKLQPFCSYLIYGKEVGETGTPHLQGYTEFTEDIKAKRLSRDYFPRAHLEPRKKTPQQASEYCKKDGDFYEYGKITQQGARTDIKELRQAIEAGMSIHDVMNEFPELYLRYHSAIEKWIGESALLRGIQEVRQEFTDIQWNPWQKELITILGAKPHPRQVHWYYDLSGGSGKSTLARYLVTSMNAFYVTGGSKSDVFHAYRNQSVVILDLARDFQGKEYIYDVMECFKNGQFLSTKYQSQMKIFPKPHVVVFANFLPDTKKMTKDRWNIHSINSKHAAFSMAQIPDSTSEDSDAEDLW